MDNEILKMCKNNYEGTPVGKNSSVRYGPSDRFNKAKIEVKKKAIPISNVIEYVNDFYTKIGLEKVDNPIFNNLIFDNDVHKTLKSEFYEFIKERYSLEKAEDIVWMIFTKDGYLGLVALSNDINFDLAKSELEYSLPEGNPNRHTTKGILLHSIGKEWDESFVLVFPLKNLPSELERHDVERGIGNYLISKGVPIIDFYSHNY